jgi:hypothetical protein
MADCNSSSASIELIDIPRCRGGASVDLTSTWEGERGRSNHGTISLPRV